MSMDPSVKNAGLLPKIRGTKRNLGLFHSIDFDAQRSPDSNNTQNRGGSRFQNQSNLSQDAQSIDPTYNSYRASKFKAQDIIREIEERYGTSIDQYTRKGHGDQWNAMR